MTDEQKPKFANLEQPETELTPAQAEEAQGGIINSLEFNRLISSEEAVTRTLQAKPTIEIG